MAVRLDQYLSKPLTDLRYQPVPKRVRAALGEQAVVRTDRAVLVWEPRRVVPDYAVPEADMQVELSPDEGEPATERRAIRWSAGGPPVLDPRVPFRVHTAEGDSLLLRADGQQAAAFRPSDPELAGYVVLEFGALQWWEEDEPIVGHPRDPFHRIDVRRSSRWVRLEDQGVVLADSDRPRLLFEAAFPMPRYYLPRKDVRVRLRPGTARTTSAYQGHATHWTADLGDRELPDIAWSYEHPLSDAVEVGGMVCFYQEKLDLFVEGERVERPVTPWS
ncbi:MAG TPA: DUF427 domain-containing protein [Dermatophilaceae bacterium]|nr:DUF427 domain-containing protein [Dermatophilaceae bacterium]